MNKAVSYLRVATGKQGRSGLGLDAQRMSIRRLLDEKGTELVKEFMDIESGSRNERNGLEEAIAYAKKADALLVIAKLDRISRRVSFIAALMESGIKFAIADLPNANAFQIHIYAALAQEERRLISERTKAALHAAKQRGVMLGKSGAALAQRNIQAANSFAHSLKNMLVELRDSGMSFHEMAEEMNVKNIPSYAGGKWHGMTVQRAYLRCLYSSPVSEHANLRV
jgi:DNA invertase Pin-like site-specific DNA recombinase